MPDKIKDCYTILSSGRSGTSCFGKMLVKSGMPQGDAVWKTTKSKGGKTKRLEYKGMNNKGEHKAVYSFQAKILADNGLTWGNPIDPTEIEIYDTYYEDFGKIITEVEFFKDPRTILFIERWWEKYPNIKVLGLFRHPFLTINSMNGRRKKDFEHGKKLYLFYYKLLLDLHKKYEFPLVEFGGETYLDEYLRLCEDLGLSRDGKSLYIHGGKKTLKNINKGQGPGKHWDIPANDEFKYWSAEANDLYEELKERKTYQ